VHLVSSVSQSSYRLPTNPPGPRECRFDKMPALPQFDYLFAIGTLFAFLDAWNIGKRFWCFRSSTKPSFPGPQCMETIDMAR
jgi:hypothetical protein